MQNLQLAQRVDNLEYYMKELSHQAFKTEIEISQLSFEMREFKNEMREFKNEMSDFKDEMSDFKTESEKSRKEMNRKWGELANKMGTLVEDLVAPSLPRVARQLFGCKEPELFGIRLKRRKGPNSIEIDALLVYEEIVFINETKSSLQIRDVEGILSLTEKFRQCFPEYRDRKIVNVIASLYVDQSIINNASNNHVLVMGMGDEAMQVLNPEIVSDFK